MSDCDNWNIVADDLSGAAEIAGVAWRFNLAAEVWTGAGSAAAGGVICLDTDTRLRTPDEAERQVEEMTARLAALRPARFFKKTDSLLRGHVLRELAAMQQATGLPTCVLCAANPARGRVVRGGRYFVDGVPLHETMFAADPTHPRATSLVAELLGDLPPWLDVPDVQHAGDLQQHAERVDESMLPAGGAEFFAALLEVSGRRAEVKALPGLPDRWFFACGSPAAWSSGRPSELAGHGIQSVRWSDSRAVDQIVLWLDTQGAAQLALADATGRPGELLSSFAEMVLTVIDRSTVDVLFLEGGATAVAVLRHLGWSRLLTEAELAPGTVLLRDPAGRGPRLVIKPGSYRWPATLWEMRRRDGIAR